MKNLILLFALTLFACTKEKESCRNYNLVTESNEKEAYYKCQGLANNYPAFNVISSQPIGCLTSSELKTAKKVESSVTQNACNGVSYTARIVIR